MQMLASFDTVAADSYDWRLNDAENYASTAQAPERG